MKHLKNNQANELIFVGTNLSTATSIKLRQLGGTGSVTIPIADLLSDCFTSSFTVNLPIDSVRNGNYLLEILDDADAVLISTSTIVEGFNLEKPLAFVVLDDTVTEEQFKELPQAIISWANTGLTFSND